MKLKTLLACILLVLAVASFALPVPSPATSWWCNVATGTASTSLTTTGTSLGSLASYTYAMSALSCNMGVPNAPPNESPDAAINLQDGVFSDALIVVGGSATWTWTRVPNYPPTPLITAASSCDAPYTVNVWVPISAQYNATTNPHGVGNTVSPKIYYSQSYISTPLFKCLYTPGYTIPPSNYTYDYMGYQDSVTQLVIGSGWSVISDQNHVSGWQSSSTSLTWGPNRNFETVSCTIIPSSQTPQGAWYAGSWTLSALQLHQDIEVETLTNLGSWSGKLPLAPVGATLKDTVADTVTVTGISITYP